jgi:hypothetical protein
MCLSHVHFTSINKVVKNYRCPKSPQPSSPHGSSLFLQPPARRLPCGSAHRGRTCAQAVAACPTARRHRSSAPARRIRRGPCAEDPPRPLRGGVTATPTLLAAISDATVVTLSVEEPPPSSLKDRNGEPEGGGSEWELIKILLQELDL